MMAILGLGPLPSFAETPNKQLEIEVPPGMRAITTQTGQKISIRFVPVGTAAASASASAKSVVSPNPAEAGATAAAAGSDDSLRARLKQDIATVNLDRPLPAAPAFVALDASPETVTRPTTPRELAASLVNGVDRQGILQSGIAIETAPYALLFGKNVSLEDYQAQTAAGFMTRLAYNTGLSIGTTKAADDSKQVRLAVGLSVTIFDKGDARLDPDFIPKARATFQAHPLPPLPRNATEAERQAWLEKQHQAAADIEADFEKYLEAQRRKAWAASSWLIAAAPTWQADDGRTDHLRGDGFSAWTTYAYGFEEFPSLYGKLQFIGHLRYRQGEHVIATDDATHQADQDSFLAAGRLRYGSPELNISAEAGYIRIWHGLEGDADAFRYGAVLEKKISENVWLTISAGEDLGGIQKQNQLFAIGALRFGSEDKPQLKDPSQ